MDLNNQTFTCHCGQEIKLELCHCFQKVTGFGLPCLESNMGEFIHKICSSYLRQTISPHKPLKYTYIELRSCPLFPSWQKILSMCSLTARLKFIHLRFMQHLVRSAPAVLTCTSPTACQNLSESPIPCLQYDASLVAWPLRDSCCHRLLVKPDGVG